MTIEDVDNLLCQLLAGELVRPNDRCALITQVYTRIRNGEKGDDLPIAMEELGCDYDRACSAVFVGSTGEALALLRAALMTKGQYLELQQEMAALDLSIAKGEETEATDRRLAEIDKLLDDSPWTYCPDRGCIVKAESQAKSPT